MPGAHTFVNSSVLPYTSHIQGQALDLTSPAVMQVTVMVHGQLAKVAYKVSFLIFLFCYIFFI